MMGTDQFAAIATNIAWIAAFSGLIWVFGHCAVWVYFHDTDANRRQAPRIYSTVRIASLLLFALIVAGYLMYR